MKKASVGLSLILVTMMLSAQTYLTDAVDMTSQTLEGTARYRAMGGAMGALGSDLSAISINPAAGAVSASSEFSSTIGINGEKHTIDMGRTEDRQNFNFTQLGVNVVYESPDATSNLRRIAMSFNYQTNNDLDRNVTVGKTDIIYQDTYMKLDDQDEVQTYSGDFLYDGERTLIDGYTDDYKLAFSADFQDCFYIGGAMGVTSSQKAIKQTVNRSNQTEAMVNDTYQYYDQYGVGVNLNIGIIAKVTDQIRLGLAYQSPTWWSFGEDTYYEEELDGVNYYDAYETLGGDLEPYYSDYSVTTPSKLTGSAAVVISDKLAVDVDYIYSNYSNIEYEGFYSFDEEIAVNQAIDDNLKSTSEVRVGAEYRITKELSLRGGYRYMESPYETYSGFSTLAGGLGYKLGNIYMDLAYDYTTGDQPYPIASGYAGTLNQDLTRSNATFTFGVRF